MVLPYSKSSTGSGITRRKPSFCYFYYNVTMKVESAVDLFGTKSDGSDAKMDLLVLQSFVDRHRLRNHISPLVYETFKIIPFVINVGTA